MRLAALTLVITTTLAYDAGPVVASAQELGSDSASASTASASTQPPLPPEVASQTPSSSPAAPPPNVVLPPPPADTGSGSADSASAPVRLEAPPPAPPAQLNKPQPGPELPDRRTERSKTFATEREGEFVTQMSPVPLHFKDAQGRWQDIGTDLVTGKDGRLHNKANAFDASLASDAADSSLARLRLDDRHSVGFASRTRPGVKAAVGKDTVIYGRAIKDADVRMTSTRTGLKEEIVLASPAAPDRFVFPLQLQGLTASIDADGNVIYRDEAGVERARTPHGFMSDASLDPASQERPTSFGVTYALIPYGKGTALEVRLDRAWLDDPVRKWPVVVDPQLDVATYPDDTYVMSGFHRDNSYDAELKVGTYNGGSQVGRSYVRFDTGQINGKVVNWAELHVAERWSWNCAYGWPQVYRVTQGWDGRTMWDWPGASFDGNPAGGVIAADGGCPNRLVKYDVRSAASYWAANPTQSFGLVLDTNAWDNNYWKKFASSEAGAPPALHVGWSEPATRPSPPQSVAASPRNAAAVVTWAPPASNGGAAITNYVVGSYIWNGSTWVLLNAYYPCGTCTSWTVSGLANGYTYVFGVWAQNSAGTSDGVTSNTIIAGTPSTPQNPAAYVRNLGALVTWTAPVSAGASAIDAYGVFAYKYPSLEYVGYTQGCGTCTSVKVTGLTNGQQYIFGVYAHNSVNWGPGVATNVITPGPTVPDAPPNVFAAPAANGTVDVAWSAPSDNGGSTIDHYWVGVYRTTPTLTYVSSVTACPTCSPRNIGGLTAGQSYQFYLAAHNAYGYGALTGSNVVTAGSSPDLLKPTNVQVTRGDGRATVTWTPPVIRLAGLTSYVVKAFLESNPTQAVATTTVTDPATSATVTGLTNGQRYFATVTASTLIVISAESARSAIFVAAGPPFAPTGVSATRGDHKATVSWLTPAENGAPITGYEITAVNTATGMDVGVSTASQSPADVVGLSNGTTYAFKVRAINAVGPGPYSGLSNSVTPAGVPFAPPNVRATGDDRRATISWGAADGNGAEIWGYVVSAPGVGSYHLGPDARMTTIFGLTNGTTYTFSVAARNVVGEGAPSAVAVTPTAPTPPPSGAPDAPTILEASATGSGQATVRWAPPTVLNGATITGYRVTSIPSLGAVMSVDINDPDATSTVMGGLANGVRYVFTVAAKSSNGDSAESAMSNPVWLAENPNGGFRIDITLTDTFGYINCIRHPGRDSTFYFCRKVAQGEFVIPGSSTISVNYTPLGQVQGGGNYAVTTPGNLYEGCYYRTATGEWMCAQSVTDTPWERLFSTSTGRYVLDALNKTRISAESAVGVVQCAFDVWEYAKTGGDPYNLLQDCASAFEPPPAS